MPDCENCVDFAFLGRQTSGSYFGVAEAQYWGRQVFATQFLGNARHPAHPEEEPVRTPEDITRGLKRLGLAADDSQALNIIDCMTKHALDMGDYEVLLRKDSRRRDYRFSAI